MNTAAGQDHVHRAPLFLITHEFHPVSGGIATFAEEMARAAVHLGHEVEVWAQSAPQASEKPWPFRMRRLALKGSHDLSCQIRVARDLIAARRRLRHATVYLPEPGPMLAMMPLQFLKAFRPRRLVLTFHGSEILTFSGNPVRRRLARRLIGHAARVSTLTAYTRDLLLEHFPEAAGKVILTPGALRSDFSRAPRRSVPPRATVVVLTVGRLHPRKGQDATLRALQALPPDLKAQVEYWMVGGRPKNGYEERLRRQAASDPDLAVRFLGDLPNEALLRAYDDSDIFALTSVQSRRSVEGFGLVYLEAAARGLPIVAHRVGGVSEAVSEGMAGLMVAPGDPGALTACFERLVRDGGLRRQLGAAGPAWAGRNSWLRAAEALFAASPGLLPAPAHAPVLSPA